MSSSHSIPNSDGMKQWPSGEHLCARELQLESEVQERDATGEPRLMVITKMMDRIAKIAS